MIYINSILDIFHIILSLYAYMAIEATLDPFFKLCLYIKHKRSHFPASTGCNFGRNTMQHKLFAVNSQCV